MGSFIREVEEGLREERALDAWRRWRWPLAGAVLLFLGSVGGSQGWRAFDEGRREASTLAFARALEASDDAFEEWRDAREEAAERAAEEEAAEAQEEEAAAAADSVLAHLETELSVLGDGAADAADDPAAPDADGDAAADANGAATSDDDGTADGSADAAADEGGAEEGAGSVAADADGAADEGGADEGVEGEGVEGEGEAEEGAEASAPEPPDAELLESLGLPVFYFDRESLSGLEALVEGGGQSPGVRLMAGMQLAWREFASGRVEAADRAWRRVLDDDGIPPLYREYAALVWAQAMLDHLAPAEIAARLRPLADDPDGAFWASASELLALAELRRGGEIAARGLLEAVADRERGAPPSAARRADALLSILDERRALESLADARAAEAAAEGEESEEADAEGEGGEGEGEGDADGAAEGTADEEETR